MNGIACMPLVQNVPLPNKNDWTKVSCPICGAACWETGTFKWAKSLNLIELGVCTKCALKLGTKND